MTTTLARIVHRTFRSAVLWRSGILPGTYNRELERFDLLSAEQRRRTSLDLLRHVVLRAYHGVDFYRRRIDDAGIDPRDLRAPEDLARFPILEKRDLLDHADSLVARGGRSLVGAKWDATGGSTGEPVRFMRSRRVVGINFANELRAWRWCGVAPGSRVAYIWGADRDISPDSAASQWKNRLWGIRTLNAFNLDEQRCQRFAQILESFQPEVIYGYATALHRFSTYLRETQRSLGYTPRLIRSTAEVLLPSHRREIEESLGGPVFDHYGSRDVGPIATETSERDGLHVFADLVFVEIVRPDGSYASEGETGDILVTKLQEFAMPLIRYRVGDRSAWLATPASGRPRLAPISGRVGDFVRTPDGRAIHGEFFTHLFYGVPGVSKFQVVQTLPDRLEILVQSAGPVDPVTLDRIRRSAAEQFDPTSPDPVTLRCVAQIQPAPSGKHRFIIPYEP